VSAHRGYVLLVDDDPAVARSLGRLLARWYEVQTCDGAAPALDALGEHHVDVVVSDFDMPGRTGAWLLREVARRYPTTGRVLVSGGDVPGGKDIGNGGAHGFVHCQVSTPDRVNTDLFQSEVFGIALSTGGNQQVRGLERGFFAVHGQFYYFLITR